MARLCILCQQPMQSESYLGITFDSCPGCAGLWFEQDTLSQIRKLDEVALETLEEKHLPKVGQGAGRTPERRCPNCDVVMLHYHYAYDSPVELDTCEQCGGLWVDDGELHKISQWTLPPMTQEEADRVALAQFQMGHEELTLREQSLRRFWGFLTRRQGESLFGFHEPHSTER